MRVQKRRRREYKTDYAKRYNLLKSEKPRVIFRKTNRYLISQYVESYEAQDKIIFGFDSRELLKYGWPNKMVSSLKSIPASYLLGYLTGKKIIEKRLEPPILDIGMIRKTHKSKIFAFLKGLIDVKIKIMVEKENFPEENRLKGEHLKNKIPFNEIKSNIDK